MYRYRYGCYIEGGAGTKPFRKLPIEIELVDERANGYSCVAEIIEQWYVANNYGTELTFLVSLQEEDGHIITTYVTRTESGDYEWEFDWCEGDKIKILGFVPILESYLIVEGCPDIIKE